MRMLEQERPVICIPDMTTGDISVRAFSNCTAVASCGRNLCGNQHNWRNHKNGKSTKGAKRIKAAAALWVPGTREEVIEGIRLLGDAQRELVRAETEMNDAIGDITARYAPLTESLKNAWPNCSPVFRHGVRHTVMN